MDYKAMLGVPAKGTSKVDSEKETSYRELLGVAPKEPLMKKVVEGVKEGAGKLKDITDIAMEGVDVDVSDVNLMAPETAEPVKEIPTKREPGWYQGSPDDFASIPGALKKSTAAFMESAALGLPSYLTGVEQEAPEGWEHIPVGLGGLAGFILGAPGGIAKGVTKKVVEKVPWAEIIGNEGMLTRTIKKAVTEVPSLTIASTVASTGDALKQSNLDDALTVLAESAKGGALMGGTFAAAKGIFPVSRIKRIATGLALLDLSRGTNPFDDRELAEKIKDYGIDVFFLWHGMPTGFRELRKDVDRILKENNIKPEDVKKAAEKPTRLTKEQIEKSELEVGERPNPYATLSDAKVERDAKIGEPFAIVELARRKAAKKAAGTEDVGEEVGKPLELTEPKIVKTVDVQSEVKPEPEEAPKLVEGEKPKREPVRKIIREPIKTKKPLPKNQELVIPDRKFPTQEAAIAAAKRLLREGIETQVWELPSGKFRLTAKKKKVKVPLPETQKTYGKILPKKITPQTDLVPLRVQIVSEVKNIREGKESKWTLDELESEAERLVDSISDNEFVDDIAREQFHEANGLLLDAIRRTREETGIERKYENIEQDFFFETTEDGLRDVLGRETKRPPSNKELWEQKLAEEGMPEELKEPESFDEDGFYLGFAGTEQFQKVYDKTIKRIRESGTLENVTEFAKGIVHEGVETFRAFRRRSKELLGDLFDSVKGMLREAFEMATRIIKGQRGTVLGPKAATPEERFRLERAKEMDSKGFKMQAIKDATGWFKGPDGLWRFMISDKDVNFHSKFQWKDFAADWQGPHSAPTISYPLTQVVRLGRIIDSYPILHSFKLVKRELKGYGHMQYDERLIVINGRNSNKDALDSIIHEVQHVIQCEEGFAHGGSSGLIQIYAKGVLDKIRDSILIRTQYGVLSHAEAINRLEQIDFLRSREMEAKKLSDEFDQLYNNKRILEKKGKDVSEIVERLHELADMYNEIKNMAPDILYDGYALLYGEIEANVVDSIREMNQDDINRLSITDVTGGVVSKALAASEPIVWYGRGSTMEKVTDKVWERFTNKSNEARRLTKRAIKKREDKIGTATQLDREDIVRMGEFKGLEPKELKKLIQNTLGFRRKLEDLNRDEADLIKIKLAELDVEMPMAEVNKIRGMENVKDSTKRELLRVTRIYDVEEGELSEYIALNANAEGKLSNSAVNGIIRDIKLVNDLRASKNRPILHLFAPIKRLFGEPVMSRIRSAEIGRLVDTAPYEMELERMFKGLNKKSRIAITDFLEGRLTEEDMSPQEIECANKVRELYNTLWEKFGIKGFIENYSPRMPKFSTESDMIDWVFSNEGLSKFDFWAEYHRTGRLDAFEKDAKHLAMSYVRAGFTKKHYQHVIPELEKISSTWDAERRSLFNKWMNTVIKRQPTKDEKVVDRLIRKIMKGAGFKTEPNQRYYKQLVSAFLDMNYMSYMGMRPKLALRNLTQQVLVMNEYGYGNFIKGRLNAYSKEVSEALEQSPAYKLRRSQYLVTEEAVNKISSIPQEAREKMMFMFRRADLDNVRVAFATGYLMAKAKGVKESAAIKAGEKAIHNTQWGYGIDLPMLFKSPTGKMFGQYMSWPIWYADHVYRMVKEKQGAKAARTAVQLGVCWTLYEAFDVDYLRNVLFGVIPDALGYGAQSVINVMKMLKAVGTLDVEGFANATKELAAGQTPGYLAARDVKKVFEGRPEELFIYKRRREGGKAAGGLSGLGGLGSLSGL